MSDEWWDVKLDVECKWTTRVIIEDEKCSESEMALALHYLSCLCFSGCRNFLISTSCVWLEDKKTGKDKRKEILFHIKIYMINRKRNNTAWMGLEMFLTAAGRWVRDGGTPQEPYSWGTFKRFWPSACPSVLSDLWVTFFFLRCFFLSTVGDVLGSFINTPSISNI